MQLTRFLSGLLTLLALGSAVASLPVATKNSATNELGTQKLDVRDIESFDTRLGRRSDGGVEEWADAIQRRADENTPLIPKETKKQKKERERAEKAAKKKEEEDRRAAIIAKNNQRRAKAHEEQGGGGGSTGGSS